MSMKLYEMSDLYRRFFETLENGGFADDNGVEDSEAINQAFDDLEGMVDEKLEACGCKAMELKAEIDEFKAAEKRIADRRKAKENALERYKTYIVRCMGEMAYTKLDRPQCRISLRKSEVTIVDDESMIPDEFKEQVVTVKVSKDAIKKVYKQGVMVPGAHIEQSVSATIK